MIKSGQVISNTSDKVLLIISVEARKFVTDSAIITEHPVIAPLPTLHTGPRYVLQRQSGNSSYSSQHI